MEGDEVEKNQKSDIEILDISDSNSNNDDSSEGNGHVSEAEEEVKESELVDWAYKVMDWLCCAVEARAWDEILKNADDIMTAFLVLVKDEHRGIVMDTFRRVVSSLKGGLDEVHS